MSELARAMERKFPTLDRDYVWALCSLAENKVNQRFLMSCKEERVVELTDEQLEAAGYEKRFLGGEAGWCWLPVPWYKALWRKLNGKATP